MDSTVRLFPAFLLLVSPPLGARVQPGALGAMAGAPCNKVNLAVR